MSPSYMPKAASGDSSRNGEPGSIRFITLSRGRSFPRAACRWRDFSEPPKAAAARRAGNSAVSARIFSALARNSALPVSMADDRIANVPSPVEKAKRALAEPGTQWRGNCGRTAKGSSDANGGPNKSKSTNSTAENAPGAATPSTKSADESKKSTTGQGAAAVSAKLSTEQRSKITTIIRSHKVEPAKLNVTVSVGTRVPDSVHFYPLPAEVFVVYPEWRGYDYILVGDEILVIDPRTHQIVAIIEA